MKLKFSIFAATMALATLLALTPNRLPAGEPDKVVRIGYQKSGALLLVKQDGSLEKKFAAARLPRGMARVSQRTAGASKPSTRARWM